MAIDVDLVLRVLGLEQLQRVQTNAKQMSDSVTVAGREMSTAFSRASQSAAILERALGKREHSLALQVAADRANRLKAELRDAAIQADRTQRALQNIGSKDVNVRIRALNDIADVRQQRMQQMAPLQGALGEARNVGLGVAAVGTAGSAFWWQQTRNAGNFERSRRAIESYEGGGKLFQQLQEFDTRSPFNFAEISEGAQNALAKDFKSTEIIPLFDALGDQVVKSGKGMEEFNASLRQIAQIRSKGKASMQDLNALSEGGGIPVIPILKEQLGEERVKGILSGDQSVSWEEFMPALMKGMQQRSKGAMGDAMTQLPGQIENLQGQLYMLGVELAKGLIPAAQLAVKVLTGITAIFRAIPAPLKTLMALWAVYLTGLTLLGGVVVLTTAQIALLRLSLRGLGVDANATSWKNLSGIMKGIPGSVATLTQSLGGLSTVMSVALPIAIATGAALMIKAWEDKMDEAYRRQAEGTDAEPSPEAMATDPKTKEGLVARADDLKRRREAIEGRKYDSVPWWVKYGLAAPTFGGSIAYANAKDAEMQGLKDQDTLEAGNLKRTEDSLRKRIARGDYNKSVSVPGTSANNLTTATSGSTITLGGFDSPGTTAGPSASYEPQIRALQDAIRAEKDKAKKAQLQEELIRLRRAEQDRKADEREVNRMQKEMNKSLRIQGGISDERLESQMRVQMAREQSARELSRGAAETELDLQIRSLENRAEMGLADKAQTEKQIEVLKAAHNKRMKDEEAATKMKVSAIEAESVMRQAQAEAMGKSAEEQKAILEKGKIKADEITSIAQIEADQLRTEGQRGVDAANRYQPKTKRSALDMLRAGVLRGSPSMAVQTAGGGTMFQSGAFSRSVSDVQPLAGMGAGGGMPVRATIARDNYRVREDAQGREYLELSGRVEIERKSMTRRVANAFG